VLSLILSIVLNLMSSVLHSPVEARFIRTDVADGSVWANVWESHGGATSLRSTVRLGDADPRLRFVPVDVDGDGRLDIVAFALDGRGLQVWRATDDDGFARVQ
jgi:hypothetical protein